MATTTILSASSTGPATTSAPVRSRHLGRTGLAAGVAAGVATSAFAAAAHAAGVSLAVGGKDIPVIGFGQVTLVAAIIGTVVAIGLARRARRPLRTFLQTTIALTLVSFVPDVLADAHTVTKLTLALSHVVAAVIVIPALAARLSD